MTATQRLEIAVHELAEAKRLAIEFGWPQSAIDRLDVLKRATANLLRQRREGKAA